MARKRYDEDFKKQLVKIYNIISNKEKYSISAMYKLLKVHRSLVYYHLSKEPSNSSNDKAIITNNIKYIFKRSRHNYGTRKIKVELEKLGYKVSRRRISRIMKENSLVSNYTVAQIRFILLIAMKPLFQT